MKGALTVDVEDWFQVQAYAGVIRRSDWDTLPRRVEANTDRMLDLLAAAGVQGTFFTLGWVAQRHGALIRRIVQAGHELASHGYGHARVDGQTPEEFRADIRRGRQALEDSAGVAIAGYRAPTFSIGKRNVWAWDVLAEEGHSYSSSTYPVRHDLYGDPASPRAPYHPRPGNPLVELPMSTVVLGGRNLPCSGGGWFRVLPYPAYRWALRRFVRTETQPALFYTHPWEIDPGQPPVPAAPRLSRLRHRVNLHRTEGRLRRLLTDFEWTRVDLAFAAVLPPAAIGAGAA